MDELLLLCLPKETHQKNNKGTRMLALPVPSDARLIRWDVKLASLKQHIPKSPAQSALLGKPERDFKVNTKSKFGGNIVDSNSFAQILSE
jgi:hypothetical protein